MAAAVVLHPHTAWRRTYDICETRRQTCHFQARCTIAWSRFLVTTSCRSTTRWDLSAGTAGSQHTSTSTLMVLTGAYRLAIIMWLLGLPQTSGPRANLRSFDNRPYTTQCAHSLSNHAPSHPRTRTDGQEAKFVSRACAATAGCGPGRAAVGSLCPDPRLLSCMVRFMVWRYFLWCGFIL